MLEREKQTGESVQAISKRTLSQTNAALLLVYEAGEWLGHELDNRSSPDFVANYEKIATRRRVERLSREICVRIYDNGLCSCASSRVRWFWST